MDPPSQLATGLLSLENLKSIAMTGTQHQLQLLKLPATMIMMTKGSVILNLTGIACKGWQRSRGHITKEEGFLRRCGLEQSIMNFESLYNEPCVFRILTIVKRHGPQICAYNPSELWTQYFARRRLVPVQGDGREK